MGLHRQRSPGRHLRARGAPPRDRLQPGRKPHGHALGPGQHRQRDHGQSDDHGGARIGRGYPSGRRADAAPQPRGHALREPLRPGRVPRRMRGLPAPADDQRRDRDRRAGRGLRLRASDPRHAGRRRRMPRGEDLLGPAAGRAGDRGQQHPGVLRRTRCPQGRRTAAGPRVREVLRRRRASAVRGEPRRRGSAAAARAPGAARPGALLCVRRAGAHQRPRLHARSRAGRGPEPDRDRRPRDHRERPEGTRRLPGHRELGRDDQRSHA